MFGFVFIILDIQVALDQLGNWARFWWILCSDRDLRFAFLHSKRLDAYKNISFRGWHFFRVGSKFEWIVELVDENVVSGIYRHMVFSGAVETGPSLKPDVFIKYLTSWEWLQLCVTRREAQLHLH